MAKRDIYQDVTDKIIAKIEAGIGNGSWQRPWANAAGGGIAVNVKTGKPYHGINVPLLAGESDHGIWGTFKQWHDMGYTLKQGERHKARVVFFKMLHVKDEEADDPNAKKTVPMIKDTPVFAAEQVEGFDPDAWLAKRNAALGSEPERIERADALTLAYLNEEGIKYAEGGNRACYTPALDAINMPTRKQFKTAPGYYSTLLHECAHSTGASNRLDRDLMGRFGREAYAFEELVAELSAAMTCGALGIDDEPRDDHAKYMQSWLNVLRQDKKAIFKASTLAKDASKYILAYDMAEQLDEAA